MTEQPLPRPLIEWDLADRMKKALRVARVSRKAMATYLDVTEGTISTWTSGRIEPSMQTKRLWAMKCGVPFEWLNDGIDIGATPPDGGPVGSTDAPLAQLAEQLTLNQRVRGSSP
jgi:transcriptional regulator with XRE-family HTH domain